MRSKIIPLSLITAVTVLLGLAWNFSERPLLLAADEFLVGDLLPDAPLLAARGELGVGVRTIDLVHKDQADILNYKDGETPRYDRPLKVEVWYPAEIPSGKEEIEIYREVLGNRGDTLRPLIPFEFKGRSLRDATILSPEKPYPLVILSHGYTGSRLLFTYLAENLASKGYVVASIDHTESTFRDANRFTSTLLNRSLDQLFVLDEMDRLSRTGSGSFLAGRVDASNTGLVGYSMGGYGALNTTGAGFSPKAVAWFKSISGGSDALADRATGSEVYRQSQDERIRAVVAFAPWGMTVGVWDSVGLQGLTRPTLFVAGSEDDISGYENGIKAIYDGAVNADRYLLTYMNARHNVAPNAPPQAALQNGLHLDEYLRYADSVWDQRRINNINQHFVTAFLGLHLQGQDNEKYLDVPISANENPWEGFKPRTAVGLELRHDRPE
ncbi:alpha/beta hydrolase family protein [Flavilitoribacter nigricans]|uniref:Dienelactone hydrolase n=1 Tax=Flavilitoribacter nigricans (strain ATCC 23147 / DSM 23189 / NBRC 102662 / NCIMB 1420 / SS-2) TaxID=1122177 RepID=A0A2D0NI95_FLAN2|nr:dienelactone hydrolase [Flavilitoribacter nigricans]PHN08110.1 dienelactone hydrolase [Flavilitoribacter nigricans DSM 23189 = NBRC 102662]